MEYRRGAKHTVMYQETKQSLILQNSSFPKYFRFGTCSRILYYYLENLRRKEFGCTGETLVFFLRVKLCRTTKINYFYLKKLYENFDVIKLSLLKISTICMNNYVIIKCLPRLFQSNTIRDF